MNNKSLPDWTEAEDIDAKHSSVKIIHDIKDMPKDVYGFIYRIQFVDGTKYIGKKNIYGTRTVKARMDGKPHPNTIDIVWKNTGKGYRQKYDIVQVESDWKNYCGSSKRCKIRIPLVREILDYAYNKYQLTYREAEALFFYQVLEDETYLNDNILGSFYRSEDLLYHP